MRETIEHRIDQLELEIAERRAALAELKRQRGPLPVEDYGLTGMDGQPVKLSQLFGDSRELLVIHNMGPRCAYCTLWADGFNGFLPQLESRVPVVLASPAGAEAQRKFGESRGWRFRMVSTMGSRFTRHLGFEDANGNLRAGVSVLVRTEDGGIARRAFDGFAPGDPYCGLYALLDLLPEGAGEWEPRLGYS